MAEDLDLYAHPIDWKRTRRIIGVVFLIVAVTAFSGYRWVTRSTAVTRDAALEIFRDEAAQADDATDASENGTRERNNDARSKARDKRNRSHGFGDDRADNSRARLAAGAAGGGSTSQNSDGTRRASEGRESSRTRRVTPEEGVYSWATEGWEEAAGIRREFPEESQRIITASDGDSWKEHHYFSEEREIWSEFVISQKGAHIALQRNRARFGPVTNDSTVDFAPPMLVGLAAPKLGASWTGEWQGRTSGTYSARIFDHSTMVIGGDQVEVWGYETRMQMRGELNGTVLARVMYSPEYAMTVQEHYEQNLETERGRYRAEWTMTVKSTAPQT